MPRLNQSPPFQPPGLSDKAFRLGLAFDRAGQHSQAKEQYRATLALNRDHVGALHNLALILLGEGNVAEGIRLVRRALARHPGSVEAYNTLGMGLQASGRHNDAIAAYRRALGINPNYAQAHNNLGTALEETGQPEQAIGHYQRAVELKPDYATACNRLGIVLEQAGRFDEARASFERAVALQPRNGEFHRRLADSKRFTPGDPQLAGMEALIREMRAVPAEDRVQLCFAVGKAYADVGDHARSFQHYLQGNATNRGRIHYDEAAAIGFLRRVQAHFTPAAVASFRGYGATSPAPIFILGMPRSGSTLVEQVLASHPKVFASGETRHFGYGITQLNAGKLYPELMETLRPEKLLALGNRYVQATSAMAGPGRERVTDKMPLNFPLLGLIHLALPNATIIHTRRDPVDCCISNFTNLFADGQLLHTYELGELGRYFRAYQQLMRHWHDVLPGVILDVQYEDLVADLELQARRIVTHCGLEWDNACLRFHETQRAVQTASVRQVRQPIYRNSVGRAKMYGEILAPLLRALEVN